LFRNLRLTLSGDPLALELKKTSKGIISWSTRGQLGIEQGIKATTGFQSGGYSNEELIGIFKGVLASDEKSFEYTQHRLRSAKDIVKSGGHVTSIHRDQNVRLLYDNRRIIIEPPKFDGFDMSNKLFDSKPYRTTSECSRQRFISRFAFNMPYLQSSSIRVHRRSVYRNYLEIGVRNFLKGYLSEHPFFDLTGTEFKNSRELMDFIYGFDLTKSVRLSKQSISHLKHRKIILRPVPKTRENISFVEYIKTKLPYFDDKSFLKL
jgi:hypothetical protein